MRVINTEEQCVGYRLNLIGVRVCRNHCHLVAPIDGEWKPIGAPRPLPLELPPDPDQSRADALIETAVQYDRERPGSDLRDLLAQRKTLDEVFREARQTTNVAGH